MPSIYRRNINNLLFIIIIGLLSGIYWYKKSIDISRSAACTNTVTLENESIKSIKYIEKKEVLGVKSGINKTVSEISYVYPDKLRIESLDNIKNIEIYNGNKYIHYDGKIKIKECFPIDKPNILEIEKNINDSINNKNYEFLGYEIKDNKRLKVISIKWKLNDHNYMQKFKLQEIKGITLPYMEEYFVDNVVISKTTYDYLKVNETLKEDIFKIESLPSSDIINDGVLSKTVESYEEAQKYLNFRIIVPDKIIDGFIPWEIGIIPPAKYPSFYCIYFDSGNRIYLNESEGSLDLPPNGIIGEYPCRIDIENETVILKWKQENILIALSGDTKNMIQIVKIAQSMAKGTLIKNEQK
ncbi:Outer membrane lipoprotein-sorting protein [Caloramator quimbayensis]|uniref:Outer membrane lipoprotein-sorting protein n=1 Tax=Caloramator quimbayensis TaxID=1147123 RepID=A0A1T4XNJ4_9CLOT|nr:hypothetical protein [Caloramator quimbayensis]SKA90681.1 Outer membrane lipoprotein-sorting protein [Caloramator quimbayensis]